MMKMVEAANHHASTGRQGDVQGLKSECAQKSCSPDQNHSRYLIHQNTRNHLH